MELRFFAFLIFIFFFGFSNHTLAAPTDTLVFSDNFDSLTSASLSGQNGWTTAGSTWTVTAASPGKNIVGGNGSYNVSPISQTGISSKDTRLVVDFLAPASGHSGIHTWLRRTGTASTAAGYDLFYYLDGKLYLDYITNTTITAFANTSVTLTPGSWYTIEFEAINDGSGNPVLKGWIYAQGGSRPGSPNINYTDTAKLQPNTGYAGLGGFNESVTADNVLVYTGDAVTPTISASPSNIIQSSTGNSIVITGVATSWSAGTPGTPTFTISGGSGASITAQTVTDSTHATLTVTAGSSLGTLTITDPSTSATTNITVAAPSNNDTVTSSAYTVSSLVSNAGTITNVPYGTLKATFESNLTKGQANQTWTDTGIHSTVLTGDTLVVLAQDGVTQATYTITVNAAASVPAPLFYLSLNGDYSDTSGNNANGVVSGTGNSFATDATRGQQVLSVNGNGWTAVNVALPTNFTKAIWIKWDTTTSSGYNNFFSNVGSHLFLVGTDNKLSTGLGDPIPVKDTITFPVSTWTHVAVTFDSSTKTYKIYRNGSMVASGADTTSPSASSQTLVGGYSTAIYSFIGSVANAEMWNSVLTADEITSVYNGNYGVTPPTAPGIPTGLTLTPGSGQISLSWTAPNNGGSAITDYIIGYKQTSGGSWSNFDPSSAVTSTIVTGLTNGTSYDFRVSAVNSVGTGTASSVSSSTPNGQNISITSPSRNVAGAPNVATIGISRDECSETFYIPYIQTSSSLTVSASILPAALPSGGGVKFVMTDSSSNQTVIYDMSSPFTAAFTSMAKSEYTLDTYVVDSSQVVQSGSEYHDTATNIGIGDIYVEIGDSVAEGYDGTAYNVSPYTDWTQAPVKSTDNRNYPQCGISSGYYQDHWQEVSHHISLNNKLETYYGYPVFILNEGVAGITSSGYITRTGLTTWQNRMTALAPNKWLLHLGINDGNGSAGFQTNMQTIINTLINTYGATSTNIVLAVPSTHSGWQPYINNLITANNLTAGPDFNTFYANNTSPTLYVGFHPNVAGHVQMGRLWGVSIISPKNVAASQSGANIQVTWNSLSSTESTISGYKVYYGTSSTTLNTVVDVGNTTSTTISSGLSNGQTYYFSVRGYDNDAYVLNLTATSSIVSVPYAIDTTAPVLSLGSPSGTLAYGTTDATLSLTTDENATCKYGIISGTAYASIANTFTTTGGTSHSSSLTGLSNATSYTYYVRCQDGQSNNNSSDYTISFSIAADSTVPTVSLTAPTNSATVSGSSVAVSADASDNEIVSGVKFYYDDINLIGSEDTSSPYSITWDSTGVADGSHTLLAVARDNTGNVATSSSVSVTVHNAVEAPVSHGGGGGFSAPYPTTPTGGFTATRDITNSQNKTVLHFGFGNDITNIAISDNINFTSATYINATSSVEWTATTTKILYIKYCNRYGRCSNPISLQIKAFVPIVSNSYKFYKNLSYRMTNSDVKELQKYLNTHGVTVAPSGAGSIGKETNYFGLLTYRAVVKFQEAHASDILTPNGLKKGTGYFGPSTRVFVNK